jgi:hypothetical protein
MVTDGRQPPARPPARPRRPDRTWLAVLHPEIGALVGTWAWETFPNHAELKFGYYPARTIRAR